MHTVRFAGQDKQPVPACRKDRFESEYHSILSQLILGKVLQGHGVYGAEVLLGETSMWPRVGVHANWSSRIWFDLKGGHSTHYRSDLA